jgi:hypothetical protein
MCWASPELGHLQTVEKSADHRTALPFCPTSVSCPQDVDVANLLWPAKLPMACTPQETGLTIATGCAVLARLLLAGPQPLLDLLENAAAQVREAHAGYLYKQVPTQLAALPTRGFTRVLCCRAEVELPMNTALHSCTHCHCRG